MDFHYELHYWTVVMLLVATDLVLAAATLRLTRSSWWQNARPLAMESAVAMAGLIIAAHLSMTILAAQTAVTQDQHLIAYATSIIFGLAPMAAATHGITTIVTSVSVDALYGFDRRVTRQSRIHTARAKRRGGRIDEALEAYRRHFSLNPDSPLPLFESASLLLTERRPHEAAELLKEIMGRFRHSDTHWCEAAYRFALYLENELHDFRRANQLHLRIVQRCPNTETGHLAGARLIPQPSTSDDAPPLLIPEQIEA